MTRSARGERIHTRPTDLWSHGVTNSPAEEFRSAKAAFPTLSRFRLNALSLAVERFERHDHAAEVHSLRVAIRRLRVVLALFRTLDPENEVRDMDHEFRRLQNRIGTVREWDVFIRGGLRASSKNLDKHRRAVLRSRALRRRKKSVDRCVEDFASKRYRKLVQHLRRYSARVFESECLSQWASSAQPTEVEPPMREFAQRALLKYYAKVRKKEVLARDLDASHLHALRVRVKKLRYLVELFSGLYPRKSMDAFLSVLVDLQDQLGAAHDESIAPSMLAKVGGVADRHPAMSEPDAETRARLIEAEMRVHATAALYIRTARFASETKAKKNRDAPE